jgi:murein DD-endopeptidase MepM/ murein hydrolase activator NlpD
MSPAPPFLVALLLLPAAVRSSAAPDAVRSSAAPDAVRSSAAAFGSSAVYGGGREEPVAARDGLALAASADFGWPILPARVVRRFDPPRRPWLAGHRGVDLAGMPFQAVRSAGAGTVVYAGVIAGRGVVSVAHAGGLRTTYEPVIPTLAVGDAVGRGTELGTLEAGHPGCAEPACLHWGLRRGDVYLDPLALLGLGRVRLLPLTDPP